MFPSGPPPWVLCSCWSGGPRVRWPWESCALQTRGEAVQGLEAGLASCVLQAQSRGRGRADTWKHLGVGEIGLCRMKCSGGAGGPGVTESSGLILQMAKLRGRGRLPRTIWHSVR